MIHGGFYILSTEPLIIATIAQYPFYRGKFALSHKAGENNAPEWLKPKYVLQNVAGWCVPWHRMARHKFRQVRHSLDGRSLHLMVSAIDEDQVRRRFFIPGGHFSHNIFINEHLYRPLPEPKTYDAIYTAQLQPFKRHWLAKDIKSLMVVSYGGDLHTYCPELKHADFNRDFLPRPELARKYSQAWAGLCLSAEEGAMLASCEYLFCGIPVVSTPSKGGRDEFFDEFNSIIVPPEPEAVAKAVEKWKNAHPDPHQIREHTLQKVIPLRKEYCTYVARLIQQAGGSKKEPEELMEKYFAAPNGFTSRFVKYGDLKTVNLADFSLN